MRPRAAKEVTLIASENVGCVLGRHASPFDGTPGTTTIRQTRRRRARYYGDPSLRAEHQMRSLRLISACPSHASFVFQMYKEKHIIEYSASTIPLFAHAYELRLVYMRCVRGSLAEPLPDWVLSCWLGCDIAEHMRAVYPSPTGKAVHLDGQVLSAPVHAGR